MLSQKSRKQTLTTEEKNNYKHAFREQQNFAKLYSTLQDSKKLVQLNFKEKYLY